MNDEQIFQLAEKCGFQDDYGRWNFDNESLLDFVYELRKEAVKPVLDSSYPDGDGYWQEKS